MCSNMNRNSCATNALTVDTNFGRFSVESIRASRFYSSRPGNLPPGSVKDDLESVYSCDSAIERIEVGDDDDSDPYDLRTKVYLDKHLEEMGYPGKNPLQLYADSKIAEVLARGTITEQKRRGKIEKLKKSLPVQRINTPDFSEANKIIEDIESALEKQRGFTTATDAFESIKSMIESEFNEQNVRFDNAGISSPGFNDVVEVRNLAMEILGCVLEEDDGKLNDDDLKIFGEFMSSRIMGRRLSTECLTVESEVENRIHGPIRTELNGSEYLKEKKCPEYLDSEDDIITNKRLILMFKKKIYKVLRNHVTMMKNSKNLMTFELFRIWNQNQEQGLLEMAQDIVRREHDLRVTIKKVLNSKRTEKIKTAKQRKDASQPVVVQERPGIKSRTKKAADCIRKREKLLRAKQDLFFLSGVLDGKIKCKGMLSKLWPKAPIKPGMPPRPPRGNSSVIDVLEKCKESNKRLITYGDMLRLLQQEGEFVPIENLQGEPVDNCPLGGHEEDSLGDQIISSFMNEESERDCPLVTKREYEDYLKILNELFFPEPDFKRIKETISFNPNAFACERPQSLNMGYSLEKVEKDTERVFGFHGHLARAVYFFRYKSEYAAVDIQDAFERYVYENNAMDSKSQQHPFGCLLLYSNVAQGIAMIEGAVLHVFNHFAGFRYSPIYKMIKTGKILYIREKVSRHYFRKWISIVVAPPLGVMTYLTASKKILNRVAEPRLFHFKEKLGRFYRIMSSNKRIGETYLSIGENSMLMAPNPLLLFESCTCHTNKDEESKKELHVPVMDLLPSPALVSYLLKYNSLKSLNTFLDELFMQPELESEDETYNIVENTILSNYVESDEEENNPAFTKEVKKLCKEREILGKLKKELDANMVKDTKGKDQPEWTKEYDIHSFNPQLVKVQVRKTEGSDVIQIDELADTDEEEAEKEDEERFVQISYDNNKFEAQRRFVNFVQTGSEAWQKKIKRFGLRGKEVKEMLQDAKNYKKLQKVMQLLVKEKVSDAELVGEVEAVHEEEEEVAEEGVGVDEEERGSAESDIGWDSAVEELEKVLEQEEPEEFMGEQMEWPVPCAQRAGEGHEFLWEGKFDEYYGEHPQFDWNWETGPKQPIDLLGGDARGYISHSGESFKTDRTVGNLEEEEESMPQAPPTSYVSNSSTDP